jgi:hypothetical protein
VASAVAGLAEASAVLAVEDSTAAGSGVRRPWKDTYVALIFKLQNYNLRAADRTDLLQQSGQPSFGKNDFLDGEGRPVIQDFRISV